jgi:hypothetical protein
MEWTRHLGETAPIGTTSVEVNGCIRVLGRNGDIPKLRYR